MKVWSQKTTALACQNFMLSMRAYGFDTCPMEGFDSSRLKKILKPKLETFNKILEKKIIYRSSPTNIIHNSTLLLPSHIT